MVGPGQRTKLTYEDYRDTPNDTRYGLRDGELIVAPSPRRVHQTVSMNLGVILWTFVKDRGLGQIYFAPFDVVLSDTDVVQPDIMFISNGRSHIITEDNVRRAPDLAIEILSPTTADRDRTLKRELYARHGVQEYWLVDPDARTVEVLALVEGGFESVSIHSQGQTLTSPLMEGLCINLDEVF